MITDQAPTRREFQPRALAGLLTFYVATAVVNIGYLKMVTVEGAREFESFLVMGLVVGVTMLYAWVWTTVTLVWSARDDLLSLTSAPDLGSLLENLTYPYSGLNLIWKVVVYLAVTAVSIAVPAVRGDFNDYGAAGLGGAVVFGNFFGLLMGVIAASMLCYPIVLLVRSFQTGAAGSGADPTAERDASKARQSMVSLALILLLVFPAATCLTLSLDSSYETRSRFNILAIFGIYEGGVEVTEPFLLWIARVLLIVIALLTVRVVTARGPLNRTLAKRKMDKQPASKPGRHLP